MYTSLIPPECKDEIGEVDLSKFNKKGDIYFFGWVLFELFTGKKYEFENENENEYIHILNKYSNENEINKLKKEFKLLIIKSLEKVITFLYFILFYLNIFIFFRMILIVLLFMNY